MCFNLIVFTDNYISGIWVPCRDKFAMVDSLGETRWNNTMPFPGQKCYGSLKLVFIFKKHVYNIMPVRLGSSLFQSYLLSISSLNKTFNLTCCLDGTVNPLNLQLCATFFIAQTNLIFVAVEFNLSPLFLFQIYFFSNWDFQLGRKLKAISQASVFKKYSGTCVSNW